MQPWRVLTTAYSWPMSARVCSPAAQRCKRSGLFVGPGHSHGMRRGPGGKYATGLWCAEVGNIRQPDEWLYGQVIPAHSLILFWHIFQLVLRDISSMTVVMVACITPRASGLHGSSPALCPETTRRMINSPALIIRPFPCARRGLVHPLPHTPGPCQSVEAVLPSHSDLMHYVHLSS